MRGIGPEGPPFSCALSSELLAEKDLKKIFVPETGLLLVRPPQLLVAELGSCDQPGLCTRPAQLQTRGIGLRKACRDIMEIVPLRLGIKYNPATLALFFQDPVGKRRVRRFRIDLSRAKSPMDLAIIAKGLADNNQQYFAGVKTEQVRARGAQRAVLGRGATDDARSRHPQLAKLVNRINFARSTGEAGTAGVSDGKDLNSVTAQELTQAKAKMSVGFEANKVRFPAILLLRLSTLMRPWPAVGTR